MKYLYAALWAELRKTYKSGIFLTTLALFFTIPFFMALMVFIVRHPEISEKMGLMAAKASMFTTVNWPSYLGLLNQMIASVGLIGFGFATAWVFGREYMERTIKDILALPVSRAYIVAAKFMVVLAWCFMLTAVLFVSGMLAGGIIGLDKWGDIVLADAVVKYVITSLLTILLCTPVAFFACYTRGLITPLGFVIAMLITAQFLATVGFGALFPWAIPGIYTMQGDVKGMELFGSSYIILGITSVAGYLATLYRWKYADQH